MTLLSRTSLGYGGSGLNTTLPGIIAELQGLTFSGPLAGVAANTAIAIAAGFTNSAAGIDIQDTILKALMVVTSTGVWTDITSTTTITDLRASGTLTLSGVVAADAVVVNGITYTCIALANGPAAYGKFYKGATDTITAAYLAAAIIAADPLLAATTSNAAVVTVKATTEGTGGNAYALSVTGSNAHVTKSGTTLAGGSATNSISSTTNTTSAQVFIIWYQKSRVVGQP